MDDCAVNSTVWAISDSGGYVSIHCSDKYGERVDGNVWCSLSMKKLSWQRSVIGDRDKVDKNCDFIVYQIALGVSNLNELNACLNKWLVDSSDFRCELCDRNQPDYNLVFSIGKVSDLVYSFGKTACTIECCYSSLITTKWSFVVDESCIRMCTESLAAYL